jgi:formylglycine-generating enzyme required for sulfatase activity
MQYERDGETKTVTGTLSDYYIAPVELSNRAWAAVMGSKPEGQTNDGDMYPVTMVNYYDIAGPGGFLEKLNTMLKDQLPAGKMFALPTEAQWQYARQAGKAAIGLPPNLEDIAWIASNSDMTTHIIGQKPGNALELHDMVGNVWEWTRDNYLELDELPAEQGKDYVASNGTLHRVRCGKGYASQADGDMGTWSNMTTRSTSIGLRLVLTDAIEAETLVVPPTADKILQFGVTNGVSYTFYMAEVKGGTYSMQYERDGVTKTVTGTLSDYYIGQTEVDNGLWNAVMGSKPEGQTKSKKQYPVSNVTYEDITKEGGFLEKLNALVANQLPTGKKFALPTEAQWHYAAMGGQKSKGYTYAGSNTLADVAWYADNADGTTHPVASKQPNELGLYDMSGNVWEWTSDKKDDANAYGAGGSYTSASDYCKVSATWADDITKGFHNMGFRLVLAPVVAPAGVEAVDLGLPSGTKWANMNVGASKPEDYGLYFAWGETVGYSSDTGDGRSFDWASYKWCNGTYDTQTKYCTTSDYGTVDNKTSLDLEDDAAYVNWGDKWRMPTIAEIQELLDNTTSEWTAQNGVYGRKFTSKSNGNYVFLPAAGYRNGSGLYYQSTYGGYWSASLNESNPYYALRLYFYSEDQYASNGSRRNSGFTVRPVLRN